MPPNTPSKALGAAFQNINIAPRTQNPLPIQYPSQQTVAIPRPAFSVDRPAHERLADVLNKALPLHPRNVEGIALYDTQITLWHSTYGLGGKVPNETHPYPLTPGTVPVASGECWKCGHRTHQPGRLVPSVGVWKGKVTVSGHQEKPKFFILHHMVYHGPKVMKWYRFSQ